MIYEYKCSHCNRKTTFSLKVDERDLMNNTACHFCTEGKLKRVISPVKFKFGGNVESNYSKLPNELQAHMDKWSTK